MTYYMFEQKMPGRGPSFKRIGASPKIPGVVTWMSGKRFSVTIPEPLEFTLDEETPGRMFVYNNVQIPLMRKDLLQALVEGGVSNLDTYRALIHDPIDRKTYDNYLAVNVVGVIAAADLDKSVYDHGVPERMISMDFDSLAIDESKPHSALMFRLAECVTGIAVHAKIKDHLVARGFGYLGFVDPKDWIG